MSDTVKLFHNPERGKSRAVLNLFQENNIRFEIIQYLGIPLSKEIIEDILDKIARELMEIIRQSENYFIINNLKNKELTRSELIEIIIQNPILLERPIVLTNNKALIARPPILVLEII